MRVVRPSFKASHSAAATYARSKPWGSHMTRVLFAAVIVASVIVVSQLFPASAADRDESSPQNPFSEGGFVTVTTSTGLTVTLEDPEFGNVHGRTMLFGVEVVVDSGKFRSTGKPTYLAWDSMVRCVAHSEETLGQRVELTSRSPAGSEDRD